MHDGVRARRTTSRTLATFEFFMIDFGAVAVELLFDREVEALSFAVAAIENVNLIDD